MRVVVSGANGFVGSALLKHLADNGHTVERLVRRTPTASDEIEWDPGDGTIDTARLEGADAIVNLAGENIGDGHWSGEKKRRIKRSRTRATRLLAQTILGMARPPKVLANASATGFYGKLKSKVVDETAPSGKGFLARVARETEAEANAAAEKTRVVHLRIGVVLAPEGGALEKMAPIFKVGVGGPFGEGRFWMSWVTLEDTVRIIRFVLENDAIRGPVNVVAPQPVKNAHFAKTLAEQLDAPGFLHVPAFAIRQIFGEEKSEELLLSGQRVKPAVLEAAGFSWSHPRLDGALSAVLSGY